jgi:putative transposase
VGIAVGLNACATLSDGQTIANPRFFREEEHALAIAQRKLSKADKGTPANRKRRTVVARVHERITWRRENFPQQHSRQMVKHNDRIAVEDLSIRTMVHNHCLAKSMHDVAWGPCAALLAITAGWAGRTSIAVNPAYTSQNCSG